MGNRHSTRWATSSQIKDALDSFESKAPEQPSPENCSLRNVNPSTKIVNGTSRRLSPRPCYCAKLLRKWGLALPRGSNPERIGRGGHVQTCEGFRERIHFGPPPPVSVHPHPSPKSRSLRSTSCCVMTP